MRAAAATSRAAETALADTWGWTPDFEVTINAQDLEAVYAFPVPKSASLSEVTIVTGEKTLQGEVLPKSEADKIYAKEKQSGNDAGLASKNSFFTYEFRIARVLANAEVRLRFVYYQPLEIDTALPEANHPPVDAITLFLEGYLAGTQLAQAAFAIEQLA